MNEDRSKLSRAQKLIGAARQTAARMRAEQAALANEETPAFYCKVARLPARHMELTHEPPPYDAKSLDSDDATEHPDPEDQNTEGK